ncbi:protein Loquacious-like isoform X5 [Rhodnius prolixus]|uniref:protein Loquacious-like isoform X5 n=1 Tax=Rhodnius prolixus TaxID=13249 RepID=UPI003D18CFC8
MAEPDHIQVIKNEEGLHGVVGMVRGHSIHGRLRSVTGVLHHRMTPLDSLPLDEAAKLELQSMPSKTPVSVLQELLSRRGVTPKYELVQVEGAIHEPTFRYRVSVGEILAMGTGRSKKEAKHAAAKAILEKLIGAEGDGIPPTKNGTPNSTEIGSKPSSVPSDDLMVVNPIGLLQELCMSRRWPPPAYETEFEEGLPHERQFTISCVVFKHKETGTGKSKKIAKRLAAHNMWQRLINLPAENNTQHIDCLDEEDMTKSLIEDINFVQMLQEIACEQQFEVTYIDIEEKSLTGKFQCLVQLSTMPVAVCMGAGTTSKDAQNEAALNALQYLKIMTKK